MKKMIVKVLKMKQVKFITIGLLSVLADGYTYRTMIRSQLNLETAKTISFVLGGAVAFIGNSKFTFKGHDKKPLYFILVYVLGLVTNILVNSFSNYLVFGNFTNQRQLSWTMATFCSACVNYIGLNRYAFE